MRRIFAAVGAGGIAIGGYIHFRLWHGVYRQAPIREMFLLNVALSAVLAVALLIPKRVFALAGAALSAGSLTALILSRTVGLPTPHGRWTEIGLAPGQTLLGVNETLLIIVAESVALVACLALVVLAFRSRVGADGRRRNAPLPPWAVPVAA
jgi:hypothetical protein